MWFSPMNEQEVTCQLAAIEETRWKPLWLIICTHTHNSNNDLDRVFELEVHACVYVQSTRGVAWRCSSKLQPQATGSEAAYWPVVCSCCITAQLLLPDATCFHHSGSVLVYTIDTATGSMQLSHKLELTPKHYPGITTHLSLSLLSGCPSPLWSQIRSDSSVRSFAFLRFPLSWVHRPVIPLRSHLF